MTRFGGLAALPFVSLVIPFLVLPVAARLASTDEWAAIGIGESIGAIAAIVIGYGWPLIGPSRVASSDHEEATRHLTISVASRAIVGVVAMVPALLLVWLLAPAGQAVLTAVAMASVAIAGLSPSWFLIGRSNPRSLAVYEVIPRLVAAAVSVAVILITKDVIWYPALMLVVTFAFQVVYLWRSGVLRTLRTQRLWGVSARALATDWHPAMAVISAGVYSAGTVTVVSIAGSVAVTALFISADKLLKAALTAVVAATAALQGWVSQEADPAVVHRRGIQGAWVLAGVGLVGSAAIFALGPLATAILFGRDLGIDFATSAAVAVAFGAIALNTGIGRLILTPAGGVKWVTVSTAVGAVVGVPAILVGALLGGVPGAAAGFALSEVVVVLVQLIGLSKTRSDRDRSLREDTV